MYGARGFNDVIIVTTKSSKSGKAIINFEAHYGFNARGVGNYIIISVADVYYEMMYESYRNTLVQKKDDGATARFTEFNS